MAKSKKASTSEKKKDKDNPTKSGIMDGISDYISNAISNADEVAAAERVARLREARPESDASELVQILIRNKCLQTGAVGAVTSSTSIVPGLGNLALMFGVAADIGWTFKMQAELVLEIAAAYQHELSPQEKRKVIMIVTGISAGANHILEKAGEEIAKKATEQLAQKSITKAIPIIGVAASGGSNMLTTYIIGRRADTYFNRGPEAVGNWADDFRAISGVDERELINWLTETTERSWEILGSGTQSAVGAVIVAGKSTGEVVVISAGKVREIANSTGKGALRGISSVTGKTVALGKWAGMGAAATANRANSSTLATGKWAMAGLASGAKGATGAVAGAGKKAGRAAAGAGQGVASGADAAAKTIANTGKKVGSGIAAQTSKMGQNAAESASAAKKGLSKAGKKISGVLRRKQQDADASDDYAEAETQS